MTGKNRPHRADRKFSQQPGFQAMNGEQTMPCAIPHQTLSVYLDGELPEKERLWMKNHLKSCPSCREALERMRAVWKRIDLPIPEPAPYPATRVLGRLTADTRPTVASWFGRLLVPAATVAVMVLGFLFGNMVGSNGNGQSVAAAEETTASVYADQFADFPKNSFGQMYCELVDGQQGR
jgi:anti-sigma factor RsiW